MGWAWIGAVNWSDFCDMNDQKKDYWTEILNHQIENFRFGIRDQNTSFSAMDTKSVFYMSSLVILAVFLGSAISDLDISRLHALCAAVVYILAGMLFVSLLVNLFIGFMAIKGRELHSGALSDTRLNEVQNSKKSKEEILQMICSEIAGAYNENREAYENKNKYFSTTQTLWIINMTHSLLLVVLLVVKLAYA